MKRPTFDITVFLNQHEGQHFERKSLFQGAPNAKRARDRREVRDQIAEYVAAFANAEGGVLILGIEDDQRPTGHAYPSDVIVEMCNVPQSRLNPPQAAGFTAKTADGVELVVFDVEAADGPVMVVGGGFPLRMGDRVVSAPESQITAMKLHGLAQSWESRSSPLRLADLDATAIENARIGAGLRHFDNEAYLLKRKLADHRGKQLVLRRAAELLFAKNGPDHPNAGIRIFRVVGTARHLGAEHNVEERPRIEDNLPNVLNEALSAVSGLLRYPSRLVGTKFREVPEYPEFSWKELVLNAVAHRDYSTEGQTTEIWMYDDRFEVLSPGGLMPEISLEDLKQQKRVHLSRNPRIVRVLVDLGYMRDQGEGMPRVFAEMEGSFLPAPELQTDGRSFSVTLRNTPTLTADDKTWLATLSPFELSDLELRGALDARRHGRIDNARLRQITGLDTLAASQLLRHLRDVGVLEAQSGGAQTFYVLRYGTARSQTSLPLETGGFGSQTGGFGSQTGGFGSQTGGFGSQTGGLHPESTAGAKPAHDREKLLNRLPEALRADTLKLGKRASPEAVQHIILQVCRLQWWTPFELGLLLNRSDTGHLTETHLSPLVQDGKLERRFPENPAHPKQAYRAREVA